MLVMRQVNYLLLFIKNIYINMHVFVLQNTSEPTPIRHLALNTMGKIAIFRLQRSPNYIVTVIAKVKVLSP